MNEKRFFIDKIDDNQYGVYDRLKIGYIEPLVYTDWTVGLDYTQSVCDLFNDCDDKMNEVYEKLIIGKGSSEVIDMIKYGDKLFGVTIKELFDRNKKLEEDIDNEKNDYRELFSNYIYLQEKNIKLIKENEKLKNERKCKLKQSENVKRFTFDTEQRSVGEIQVIIDNKEKKVYANCFSICDLLNEQQSTILFLQDEIDELKKDIDIYEYEEKKHSKTARKLYEENEQLRKELKELENNYKDLLYDGGFDE